MRVLVWFRRDLRVVDQRALHAAARDADEGVVAVWLATPKQWERHDEAPAKIAFWMDGLRELSVSLADLGIPLVVERADRFAEAPAKILAVAARFSVDAVYWNHEYEVNEASRDAEVRRRLDEIGIRVRTFHDRVVLPPGEVLTKDGRVYTVFSPFRRSWLARLTDDDTKVLSRPRRQSVVVSTPSRLDDTALVDLATHEYRRDLWPAGEAEGKRRLDRFTRGPIKHYEETRDLPGTNGTSLLSPYLAAGFISPRQCLAAARRSNGERVAEGDAGPDMWISELIWREFYTHVLVGFPRVSKHEPFDLSTRAVRWSDDDEHFEAWCEGRTGYPIVDAAMRQLLRTGWMHNRLRMITAMFLTKDLLVDWRRGERHFMRHLIDGDLASNNGGWQWSASTGTDPAPYFRVFNPVAQSRKCDPEGRFIRKLCPELAELTATEIHDPSRLSTQAFAALGYPPPIVDHRVARERAITAFREARGGNLIRPKTERKRRSV